MTLFTIQKPDYLASGERARLIPALASTSKERRITSSTLAAFMSVNEFAKGLLDSVGVRLGKTSKVECFTEIVLKRKGRSPSKIRRPDGLIVVTTGKKQWSALVEAKIGKAELQTEQVETYLDLAREHNIDSVITISNQFAASPTHYPLIVDGRKTQSVSLYHWSWTYLIAEAIMWVKYYGVTDPDQAYILEELVRYLQHDSSGVTSFVRMNSTWKDVCGSVQSGIPLKKGTQEVLDSVGSWHQFTRNLSLHLSLAIGEITTIFLKKAHRDNPNKRLDDDTAQLINDKILTAEFDVPGAASRIKLTADVKARTVTAYMRVKAPEERATTKGRINWLVGQLKRTTHSGMITVRAIWPSRAPDTMAKLSTIRKKGFEVLLCDNNSLKPIAFEVALTRDLDVRFKGARTFIQKSEPVLLEFYEQAGQYIKEWVPPPPKIKTKDIEALIDDMESVDIKSADEKVSAALTMNTAND